MKRLTAVFLCAMLLLIGTVNVQALSDPVKLQIVNLKYNEDQTKLIAEGFFVNAGTNEVSITNATIEIKNSQGVIATKSFPFASVEAVSLTVGGAKPWTFEFDKPKQWQDLTKAETEVLVSYNSGKQRELPAGKKVYYNGEPIAFDVKPAVIQGRMMIPARAVFEKMGATVVWNGTDRSMTVMRGDIKVILFVGNDIMMANGKPVKLEVAAQIIDGRTLVPLRAISSALGANVFYGDSAEMAVIYE